jgi:hypothetical protein
MASMLLHTRNMINRTTQNYFLKKKSFSDQNTDEKYLKNVRVQLSEHQINIYVNLTGSDH